MKVKLKLKLPGNRLPTRTYFFERGDNITRGYVRFPRVFPLARYNQSWERRGEGEATFHSRLGSTARHRSEPDGQAALLIGQWLRKDLGLSRNTRAGGRPPCNIVEVLLD